VRESCRIFAYIHAHIRSHTNVSLTRRGHWRNCERGRHPHHLSPAQPVRSRGAAAKVCVCVVQLRQQQWGGKRGGKLGGGTLKATAEIVQVPEDQQHTPSSLACSHVQLWVW
jgi:hypothetical protein